MKWFIKGTIVALIILILYGVLRPSLSRDTRPQTDKIWKLGYQNAITSIDLRLDDYVRDHQGRVPDSIEQLLNEPTNWLSFESDGDDRQYVKQIENIIERMVIKPRYRFSKGSESVNTIAVLIPKGSVDSGEYVYCTSFAGSGGYTTVADFESSADKSFLEELRYRDSHPGTFKIMEKADGHKNVKLYIVSEKTIFHDQSTTKP